jgi:hypothetical protein
MCQAAVVSNNKPEPQMPNYPAVKDLSSRPEMLQEKLAMPRVDDRRSELRFSLRLAVKCRRIESRKSVGPRQPLDTILAGESLNVSSKGLIFRGSEVFRQGQAVEVFIEWPVRLENRVRLMLVAEA